MADVHSLVGIHRCVLHSHHRQQRVFLRLGIPITVECSNQIFTVEEQIYITGTGRLQPVNSSR